MKNTKTDNKEVSVQGCSGGKGYQSIYNKPTVWTAPWCNCGSWINRPCPPPFPPCPVPDPCPPYYQCPPTPVPPPFPPFPPCPPPPFPPRPPYHPQPCPPYPPKPCPPAPPPKPKPPKPNFPENCPQDMLWLMVGYWMGSNCQWNT